jgi:putative ABC transport system permease protein
MNTLRVVLRLFRSTARIQRKRMILTVTAIAWGTISIILLLSFGQGLQESFTAGSRGLGEGIAISWAGRTQKAFNGFPPGRLIRLAPEDVALLLANVPEIELASGEMRRWSVQLSYEGRTFNQRVTGVEPIWGQMRSQIPEPGGRFINELDQRQRRRVLFIGNEVRDNIFGEGDAVGETVLVNGVPFTVVGVLDKKLQMGTYAGPDSQNSIMPLSTFQAVFGTKRLDNLVFRPAEPALMGVAKDRFYQVMGGRYRFDPTDTRALPIWDTQENQEITAKITVGIKLFLGLIGGLTLLIGGVGVANIMYAAVASRTREIGILMAMGARRNYVTGPLVLESLALTFTGGALGIAVGAGIVHLLAFVQSQVDNEAMAFLGQPTLSLPIAATTVVILGALGWMAGYFPSRRATTIQPAAVLRTE